MSTDRRELLLAGLDLATDRGFEIGALSSPIAVRPIADVVYLDHATTEDLRRKYAGDPNVGEIVPVDEVWAGGDLSAALGARIAASGPFQYAIASHVIEHVPDVVGWLQQIAYALEPGGTLRLAVPDKRYCFDVNRTITDAGAIVAAHLERRTKPGLDAVFDFWSRYTQVDAARLWAGEPVPAVGPGQDALALEKATEASDDMTGYHDVHSWVFTPSSFVDVLERLAELDLLPFTLQHLHPTAPGDIELIAILERLPEDLEPDARRARQRAAIDPYRQLDAAPEPAPIHPATGALAVLSPREEQLLQAKRWVGNSVRRVVRRLRP